jgi:hypothetical protein
MYLYFELELLRSELDTNYIPDTLTLAILRNSRWQGKKTTRIFTSVISRRQHYIMRRAALAAYAGWLRDFECLQISNSPQPEIFRCTGIAKTDVFLGVINIKINYTSFVLLGDALGLQFS